MQNRHRVRINLQFSARRLSVTGRSYRNGMKLLFPVGLCRKCIARIGGSVTIRPDLRFA